MEISEDRYEYITMSKSLLLLLFFADLPFRMLSCIRYNLF